MGRIVVTDLGKAYRQYPTRWSRLLEWILPFAKPRHQLNWVLQDINFLIVPGEAVGIIGINGAGKSTLLKLITHTTQPTTGSTTMEGRVAALLELGMGFHPDFTGRQNVFMAGQLLGLTSDDVARLMPEIQRFAEIGDYIDQPVRVYSSGMQMRLAFSVATAVRPDILIVDEALSVGDAYFQLKCFSRIRDFQRMGTTLLLVSHDLAAIRAICNRAIWLDKGSIRDQGDTKNVVDNFSKALYEKRQDISGVPQNALTVEKANISSGRKYRDCRIDYINNSNLRNDIQVIQLGAESDKWGDGLAKIIHVGIYDSNMNELSWIVGGEEVVITISATAIKNLENAFLGFQVRDRLGQVLFGDSTFLTTYDKPVELKSGCTISAKFKFVMPLLPQGVYQVHAAIASGTQSEHNVHDWNAEGILFESHNQSGVNGLIGVPINQISMDINSCE